MGGELVAKIEFNYNKAIKQATQIDDIARDMQRLSDSDMRETLDSISTVWKGEASRQFIGSCAEIQEDIQTRAKELREISRRIREVARTIKEAEEQAQAIVQQ
jgi:WXG100 family type VII secretion target